MKILFHILIFSLLLISCKNIERDNLIAEFENLEAYRIWLTEKSINENDSVYHERKTFKAFDSNDRLINEGNFKFYYYQPETERIIKTTAVFKRDKNVKIYYEKYEYDENGLLKCILRIGEVIDTVKTFKYDENKNQIESKTEYRTITQEFEDGLLKKKINFEGDTEAKVSEFTYDPQKRPLIEDWVFSGDQQMQTRFEYYNNGNLFRETDSSYVQVGNSKPTIEFRDEYKYDKKDSIVEIIKYGRRKNESTFFLRGRKTLERRLEIKK